MLDKLGNTIGKAYRGIATKFMTPMTESKFFQTGMLTSGEFVLAGDQLAHKCPTWRYPSVEILPVDGRAARRGSGARTCPLKSSI